jgi:phosphatidate cytidylyltransferase
MSPRQALDSPIFRAYAIITLAVLIAAGILIAVLRYALRKEVRGVWITYRSWLVMLPVVFAAIFAGRQAVVAGVTLVAVLAFKEYARATGLYRDWWMTTAVYAGIVGVGAASAVQDPFTGHPGWWGLFLAMPVYAICLLLIVPILRNRTEGQLQSMALGILGFIYIGWMFSHLGFLANSSNPYGYLLFVILCTELNDVAAFTFGKLAGRRPLRSNISPRKTWEGALGALAVAMALPWIGRFSLPGLSPVELLLAGAIIGVGGQLGDLCISVIKRDIGIKDMGGSIPGHGGVLDRIDSLIFVAPLFLHMIQYFHGLR